MDEKLIVDDNYLIEKLKISPSFINRHAPMMGSFSSPRRYILANVMSHLENLAEAKIRKVSDKRRKAEAERRVVTKIAEEVFRRRR